MTEVGLKENNTRNKQGRMEEENNQSYRQAMDKEEKDQKFTLY